MKRNKRITIERNLEEVFHDLMEMIMENVSDSFLLKYVNLLACFRIDMQSISAYDQVNEFIDQIAFKNEAGVVILPKKFEEARNLILQLDGKKLQDAIDLTNE